VVQIVSPRSIGRLVQRAGRSAHQPGRTSNILFVPTHALEFFEIAAFRRALSKNEIEPMIPPERPYDVLIQHIVTLAAGEGFEREALFSEIRSAYAHREFSQREFDWVLDFIENGGKTLGAYPRYHKIFQSEGKHRVSDVSISRMHGISIGTITSDSAVKVCFTNGKEIGTVEERFFSKLKKGDVLAFAGKSLELVSLRGRKVVVRISRAKPKTTATWKGSKLTFSFSHSAHIRHALTELTMLEVEELEAIEPILIAQKRCSHIPDATELLVEVCNVRGTTHLFVFPFEGRSVREGIAALWALRFAGGRAATFSLSASDYGFVISGPAGYPFSELFSKNF